MFVNFSACLLKVFVSGFDVLARTGYSPILCSVVPYGSVSGCRTVALISYLLSASYVNALLAIMCRDCQISVLINTLTR